MPDETDYGTIEIKIKEVAAMKGIYRPVDLARRVGVSRETARHLLDAQTRDDLTRIGIKTLEKLCHGLKVSPGRLLVYHPKSTFRQGPSGTHDDPASLNTPRVPPS